MTKRHCQIIDPLAIVNHHYNITVFKHIPLVSTFQDLCVHRHNDGFKFLMGQTVEEPGVQLKSGLIGQK